MFSPADRNKAIGTVLERLNTRLMRHLGLSRGDLIESVERPVLPLSRPGATANFNAVTIENATGSGPSSGVS